MALDLCLANVQPGASPGDLGYGGKGEALRDPTCLVPWRIDKRPSIDHSGKKDPSLLEDHVRCLFPGYGILAGLYAHPGLELAPGPHGQNVRGMGCREQNGQSGC